MNMTDFQTPNYIVYIFCVLILLVDFGCNKKNHEEVHSAVISGVNIVHSNSMPDKHDECNIVYSLSDSVFFNAPSAFSIGYPTGLRRDARGNYLVGGLGCPVLVFDSTGNFMHPIGAFGVGPGEYSSNYKFDLGREDSIYVIDVINRNILMFDQSGQFNQSNSFPKTQVRKFDAGEDGYIYILNDNAFGGEDESYAVARFTQTGRLDRVWGRLPGFALLQAHLEGGGIAVDVNRNAVFFGYMGSPLIYKTTLDGRPLAIFDIQPDYFIHPDDDVLRELATRPISERPRAINRYASSVSWVTALFATKNGFVFQQILEKLSRGNEPLGLYLEVWDADGYKLASKLKTPDALLFADQRYLYFLNDIDTPDERFGVYLYTYANTCTP